VVSCAGMSGRGGGLRLYGGVSYPTIRREAGGGSWRGEVVVSGTRQAGGMRYAVLDACRGCRYQCVGVDVD
jgi:hypothetical protein